jgi:uncharacterized coiled-coil DUF342 family protein
MTDYADEFAATVRKEIIDKFSSLKQERDQIGEFMSEMAVVINRLTGSSVGVFESDWDAKHYPEWP